MQLRALALRDLNLSELTCDNDRDSKRSDIASRQHSPRWDSGSSSHHGRILRPPGSPAPRNTTPSPHPRARPHAAVKRGSLTRSELGAEHKTEALTASYTTHLKPPPTINTPIPSRARSLPGPQSRVPCMRRNIHTCLHQRQENTTLRQLGDRGPPTRAAARNGKSRALEYLQSLREPNPNNRQPAQPAEGSKPYGHAARWQRNTR